MDSWDVIRALVVVRFWCDVGASVVVRADAGDGGGHDDVGGGGGRVVFFPQLFSLFLWARHLSC